MNPQTVLMNQPTPNAFAAFYPLSATERVAAAIRLVAVLKRERRRVQKRHANAIKRDSVFGGQDGERVGPVAGETLRAHTR